MGNNVSGHNTTVLEGQDSCNCPANEEDIHLLLVEDSEEEALLTRRLLEKASQISGRKIHIEWVSTYPAAREALHNDRAHPAYDVCLVDYYIGGDGGLQLLQEPLTTPQNLPPIILLTGRGNYATDLEAERAGAADFLDKDHLTPALLERSIRYAIRRRRAEDARQQAEEERDRFFDLSHDFHVVADMDGYFLQVSSSWIQAFGYSLSDLTSRPFLEFVHPDDRDATRDVMSALSQGEFVHRFDNRYRRSDGTYRWIQWNSASSVPDRRIYATARDITEERAAREDLRLLDRALQDVPIGVIIADGRRPGGQTTYVNRAFERLSGYAREEILGRNCSFLQGDDRDQEVIESIRNALRTRSECQGLLRNYRKDGTLFWNEFSLTPVTDEAGTTVTHFIAIMRDVTDRIRLQQQVIQNEKLAALGELVAGVAHEVNNPLAAISGYAQLLQMHADPHVQGDAAAIQEMAQRASRIVRSLRFYARPTGILQQKRVAHLNDLVQAALDVVAHKLRKTNVDVVVEAAGDLPAIAVNEGEIEQVLVNLLANAEYALRTASPEARCLTIRTRLEEAVATGNERSSPFVIVTVADTGCGMPPSVLERIFDPFFTTKDTGEGTGLGLYISHSIVVAHGGTIEAASEEGKGTAFTIRLPALTADPSDPAG